MGMVGAAGWKMLAGDGGVHVAAGTVMFFGMLMVALALKLAGLVHLALTPGGVARFGGARRLARSALAEFVLSTLMAPVIAFQVTVFLLGLLLGHRVAWNGQNRDVHRVEWRDAAIGLWPQTLFGLALLALGAGFGGWMTLTWAAPVIAGLVLAVPFAVVTASPALGRWAQARGVCALPEEVVPSEALSRLRAEMPQPPMTPLQAA